MTPREQGDTIRTALGKLSTIKVAEESYLKLEDALNATEAILYPEGLQTEEEYNRLIAVTNDDGFGAAGTFLVVNDDIAEGTLNAHEGVII